MKDAGAASNAYTTDDLTVYHTTFSKEDLETILRMEADRFQNLEYSRERFQTETLAVLGEYNKNSASPSQKLYEVLRDTAFDKHTYKHTTMGFLKDIQDMPNQYEYSRQFFDRYYRPEYTTIIVAGDVKPRACGRWWTSTGASWKRGSFSAAIPAEPAQAAPRTSARGLADPDAALGRGGLPRPRLFGHRGRPGGAGHHRVPRVLAGFRPLPEAGTSRSRRWTICRQTTPIASIRPLHRSRPASRRRATWITCSSRSWRPCERSRTSRWRPPALDAVKKHLRYSFALQMNNSEAIAPTLARYVALRRTPETLNRLYELYAKVTPEDSRGRGASTL